MTGNLVIAMLTAVVLTLMGLALGVPGAWLVGLGGSWYYLIAGLALMLTALLMFGRRSEALWLYAALLIGSLIWAVWEIGFDWWQLGTRGGVLVLVGIWLWLPFVRKGLTAGPRRAGMTALALANLAAIVVAGYSLFQDPLDISGSLPTEIVAANADLGATFDDGEWHQYGRTPYGQRYSPLDQITVQNVSQLQPAWTYRTGDVKVEGDVPETTYQVTALKIGNALYVCTPHNLAIAINAGTGEEIWRFDANSGLNQDRQHQTCRGVTYWRDAGLPQGAPCAERVYLPTADARLIALDALNGQVCAGFAEGGTLHLEAGMPYNPAGYYYSTSPPVAVAGKLIIGGAVNDNYSTKEPSGVIRAFDINTGALLWNWDSGNPTQTAPIDIAGGETYTPNSPNSWSIFAVDEALGLVYVPLGNKVPDQLGMDRSPEVEKYSSSIVALDITSGRDVWVQQFVHHDLWDMDVPAQPVLLDINDAQGNPVPALVGPTKQGDIYVLDRRTGAPILPITEEPAPGGTIPEDFAARTQPTSALSFKPAPLQEKDMWGVSLFDQVMCRIEFHKLNYEGRYTPPSVNGSIIYPGNFGVFNWGSIAIDPERQVMFGMPTYLAFTSRLVPRAEMPSPDPTRPGSEQGPNQNEGAPYGVIMGPFLSPIGIPCQAPPWGYVAGADLRTGDIAYKHRNGTTRDMTPMPLPFKVGVPGIGGPMITKGGVAFLGAAVDNYFRAYDLTTGAQLWETRLPAGGQSTPMTYTQDGQQYVVIVAGGHGSIGTTPGDFILAYKLPQ